MPPSAKYKGVWKVVASTLLGPKTRNKLLTTTQYAAAFKCCVKLGGGVGLTDVVIKKSFSSRGDNGFYFLCCESMGIGYEGNCVLVGLTSLQLKFSGPRHTAFGVFDSAEIAQSLATKENVLDDKNVGRLQLSLPDSMKAELVSFLCDKFPQESLLIVDVQSPSPKLRCVSKESAVSADESVEDRRDDIESDTSEADTTSFDDSPRDAFDINDALLSEDVSSFSAREKLFSSNDNESQLKARQAEIVSQLKDLQSEYKEIKNKLSETDMAQTIYYIHNGWAGRVTIDEHEILTLDDIKAGLDPISPDMQNNDCEETRRKKNYEIAEYGVSTTWIPCGTSLCAKNKQGAIEENRDVVRAMRKIFCRKKCVLSQDSLDLLSIGTLFAPGCSDEGAIFIMTLTVKSIINEIQIKTGVCLDISNQDIAQGLPSRSTLANCEGKIAALSLLKVSRELIVNKVDHVAAQADHGNRSGCDHYPKTLHFAKKVNGQWRMQRPTLDVDSSGHTAEACATAWEISLSRLPGLNFIQNNTPAAPVDDDTETTSQTMVEQPRKRKIDMVGLTGDRGGGASIQNMFPAMKRRRIMSQTSIATSCTLHGKSKPLENAWTSAMGRQGIGCRSPSQMMYVFSLFQKAVKQEVKLKGLQQFVGELINKLLSDAGMQTEANKNFKQAYDNFMIKLDAMTADLDVSEEELQNTFDGIYELPTNMQDPVFSRWMTIMKAVPVFIENWTKIYFLAASVKQWTSSKYVQTLANTLLSLMNTRSKIKSIATQTQEQDTANHLADENSVDPPLKPGDTPTFYAMLLFADAFGRRFYNDHFNWQLRDHHFLDKGSNGHTAPDFCVRVALMVRDLDEMIQDDGFLTMPEFNDWVKALDGVPKVATDVVDYDYHLNVARKFLQKYRITFHKHIVEQWTDGSKTHYMLAGEPEHACALARILVDARAELDGEEKDEWYEVPDREITLPSYHTMTRGPIQCNVKQTMSILTDNVDFEEVLKIPFIISQWDQIKLMADQAEAINIWIDDRFKMIREAAIRQILIHPIHQQQSELMVQAAALVAKTHVAEDRRTNRTIAITNIVRPANAHALAQRNAELWDEGEDPIKRIQGSRRVSSTLDFIDGFRDESNQARVLFGDEIFQSTVKKLNAKSKQSASEIDSKIASFKESLQQPRKKHKAEKPLPHEIPAEMGGGIYWRMLTMKNGALDAVNAEMKIRHIPMTADQQERWNIGKKRKMLRTNELSRLCGDGTGKATQGITEANVLYIVPLSDEMKNFMSVQIRVLNEEQGIEGEADDI